jgi:hypothetical protein
LWGLEVHHVQGRGNQIEIPDDVRKLMGEHPELRSFIENILLQNRLLELQVHELELGMKKLEHANKELRKLLEKLMGPVRKGKLPVIRIRTIRRTNRNPRKSRPYHRGVSRTKPKEVDEVVTTKMGECPAGHKLGKPIDFEIRFVEEIVPAKVVRKQYIVSIYWCRECKQKVRANSTDVLPHERFGINLMLLVCFMRMCGITFEKIRSLLGELYALKLTKSALMHMEKRVADEFADRYEQLKQEIRKSEVVHMDETGWPINGRNHWLWTFVTKEAAWYAIKSSRGRGVVEETLGEGYDGVVVSDFYPAFDKLKYRGQKCLLHLLRNPERVELKRGKNLTDEFREFASSLRRLVRDAVKSSESDPRHLARRKRQLERRLRSIFSRRYRDKNCKRICKLLKRHRDNLFTFLEVEGVGWNNNEAERALRPSVVVRKNSYGSKSELGARNHSILMTVGETCKKREMNFMNFGRGYLQTRASYGLQKR